MNEVEEVESTFRDYMGLNLTTVDAQERFLSKLKGVTDPEQKRKIIGEEFIRVFEQEAKKEEGCEYLIQGTIYSDVIESAKSGKKTFKIKSHHNVGGLPEDIDLKIVEPLKELFKDEVRSVGEILGLPREILYRHPFPGPGLAIRIMGEINDEKLTILKKVDNIFINTLKETGWYDKVWQAFAVLIPVKTVGITGDKRSYGYVAALRSVDSVEGMTADWSKVPFEILDLVSSRITNEVEEITRVVYDISSKPPATIEWE
jgi:GMP synthase (glutamine-hydrolysing)